MQHYDVIVVGLGAMGSAAAFQLAKSGTKVLGLDQHTPPHIHGSTHGESRLTRQAIGEGFAYVPFALRAHEIWREIEAETGEKLLNEIGAVMISSDQSDQATAKKGFLATTEAAAKKFDIQHEMLTPAEVRSRFPNFLISDNEHAYFEPGAGYLRAEQCVDNQLKLAEKYGADLRYGQVVGEIMPQADGAVNVRTQQETFSAAKVILSAGPWVRSFLHPKWHDIFQPTRQVLHWLDIEKDHQSAWEIARPLPGLMAKSPTTFSMACRHLPRHINSKWHPNSMARQHCRKRQIGRLVAQNKTNFSAATQKIDCSG